MGKELLFQEIEGFEWDLQLLDATARQHVVARVNEVAQAFVADASVFASLVSQPVALDLGEGYDSSLYAVEVEPDVHLVLAVDDDPIFSQAIVTLMRCVSRASLQSAYRDAAAKLYGSMPGFVAPQEVAVG